jgi:hypothetical protein
MSAKIRINSDRSLIEIETPEGEIFGPMECPQDEKDEDGDLLLAEPIFCTDEENPDSPAYICVVSEYEGLRTNTVYQLVPITTEVQLDAELEEDEDEEEEEDDDGGVLVNG